MRVNIHCRRCNIIFEAKGDASTECPSCNATYDDVGILHDAKPRVLNKSKNESSCHATYVGRPTIWGNPYVIGKDGTREEVIAKHAASITPEMKERAKHELRGRDLVCWCAPLACHADTWLRIANE